MSEISIVSRSVKETSQIAALLAKEIAKHPSRDKGRASIIALEGELGSGKTTFAQGFARALGVGEGVLSPTFVLMKIYKLSSLKFKHLVHIDCYRLGSEKEFLRLGFKDLSKDKDAMVIIEWADRVGKLIPKGALRVRFRHGQKPNERIIEL